MKRSSFSLNLQSHNKFVSVIIPVRNEERNVELIINRLEMQSYPHSQFECIIVNDHSSDATVQKLKNRASNSGLQLSIVDLPPGSCGKKRALQYGIQQARGELILTTDADCINSVNWLQSTMAAYQQEVPDMIVQPVLMHEPQAAPFESMEQLLLTGIACASASLKKPVVCSGANLAFRKQAFDQVGGYSRHLSIASGDDVFLMQAFKKHGLQIKANTDPDAVVYTSGAQSIGQFLMQRLRWAAKVRYYRDFDSIASSMILGGMHLALVLVAILSVFELQFAPVFLVFLLLKSAIDLLFLHKIASSLQQNKLLRWFPVAEILYLPYSLAISLASIFVSVKWKGRSI